MASGHQTYSCFEDLKCCVCWDLFQTPVTLTCGHHFCMQCIDKYWESEENPACPLCRVIFPGRAYVVNFKLARLVKIHQSSDQDPGFLNQGQKRRRETEVCAKHTEDLKLFCLEDESLICESCIPEHPGHSFLSLENAAFQYMNKLKTALTNLELKAELFRKLQNEKEEKASSILEGTAELEEHISSEFARLHQFLQQREEQLIQQLRRDIDRVLKTTEEAVTHIKEQSDLLQEKISQILSQLESQDPLHILLGAKEIEEKPPRKEEEEEDEGDECRIENFFGVYNGPLQFSAWKSMSCVIQPGLSTLTLNPVTAHTELSISEDLSSVYHGDKGQQLPNSPTRFDHCACVLGCEGFTTGTHYWEVEVGAKTKWDVGVTLETARRKGFITRVPEEGYWVLCLRNGDRYMAMDSMSRVVLLHTKPKRIGIYLDYEGGQVSFYNASNMSHIYTFKGNFTETLYPYFSPCFNDGGKNIEPLRLFRLIL